MIEYIYYVFTLIWSFDLNFLCVDMFSYDDSEIVSARVSVHNPRKEITLASSISVLY